jgi:hypothetical protein
MALLFIGMVLPLCAHTQAVSASLTSTGGTSSLSKGLFESEELLEITLRGNIRELVSDRFETSPYRSIVLQHKTDTGSIAIPIKVKTRGHFRKLKGNCTYPPLLLNVQKSEALKSPIFREQDKIKLVMPCQGAEYVVREWLVYKLYNLITPKSFAARLVSVTLDDTDNQKVSKPFYGILLEDEKQLAKRNGNISVKGKFRPEQTRTGDFLKMALFEYLIGNTDWSVVFLHNIKLIAPDSMSLPSTVPYDFDHAGLVDAPYAQPPEQLGLSSVRERRYRGYCISDLREYDEVIAWYNKLRKDIYALYTNCPLLQSGYVKATTRYFDEFYDVINDARYAKKELGEPCDEHGTGNVLIKGLGDN